MMVTATFRPTLPRVGSTLDDRFELRAVIGEGGMSHVFRAYDHHGAREIALKLLAPRYLGRPEREIRFLREAELGRRARHRNLAEYLDAGHLGHEAWPFLAMEIIEGRDLGLRLARGPLPPHVAIRVARQLAGALLELHRAGVVHRDVTPKNVLMRGDEAVLIDLSHAGDTTAPQLPTGEAGRLTQPHEVPGTHYYMPPEQAKAAPAHPAMDVYGFGITLIEALTGRAPSGLDRKTFIAMQREGRFAPPRVDVRVHCDVPEELAELAHFCTHADPLDRPSFEEIVRSLDGMLPMEMRAARREPLSAEVESAMARAVTRWASDETEPPPPAPAKTGHRRIGLALAMATMLGLAAAAWRGWSGDRVAAEPAQAPSVVPASSSEPDVPPPAGRKDEPHVTPPSLVPPKGEPTDATPPEAPVEAPVDASAPPVSPKPRPADTTACAEARKQASRAVAAYDWSKAVELTSRRQCWHGDVARRRILVQGLFHQNRWAECVRAGDDSKDPEVSRWVEFCKRHVD